MRFSKVILDAILKKVGERNFEPLFFFVSTQVRLICTTQSQVAERSMFAIFERIVSVQPPKIPHITGKQRFVVHRLLAVLSCLPKQEYLLWEITQCKVRSFWNRTEHIQAYFKAMRAWRMS